MKHRLQSTSWLPRPVTLQQGVRHLREAFELIANAILYVINCIIIINSKIIIFTMFANTPFRPLTATSNAATNCQPFSNISICNTLLVIIIDILYIMNLIILFLFPTFVTRHFKQLTQPQPEQAVTLTCD
jgi:hypothetical protein